MKQQAQGFKIGVVGATGLVGRTIIDILNARDIPIQSITAIASERSAGELLQIGDQDYWVQSLADFDFNEAQLDVCFFSAGSEVSQEYAPKAEESGAYVIDNTSHFRYQDDIALVVPEVNPFALHADNPRRIIANPNCATIGVLLAIKPIYDAFGIETLECSTYQSVSGSGASALRGLHEESVARLNGQALKSTYYDQPIGFNVIPKIDAWMDNGFTKEEMKMHWETQKMLDSTIQVNTTCVRVPVMFGHGASVHLKLKNAFDSLAEVENIIRSKGLGVALVSENPPTPASTEGVDDVLVGRLRPSMIWDKQGLNLWVVSDNIRKGAALNAVQILELLRDKALV